jgi:hypothetical protein
LGDFDAQRLPLTRNLPKQFICGPPTNLLNRYRSRHSVFLLFASTIGETIGFFNLELWIYDPALIGPGSGFAVLVWRIEVMSSAFPPIRELVLVDAQRGSAALHFNQVESARNRLTYTANNGMVLPGMLVCDEANTCLSPAWACWNCE